MAQEHWSGRGPILHETSALLGVTATQDGKVSDVRTRCHNDVAGLTLDASHCHSRAACVQTEHWHRSLSEKWSAWYDVGPLKT